MSILGDAAVSDPAVLHCNRCRKMFFIDCTNVTVSNSILSGAVGQSRAATLRKRNAQQQQQQNGFAGDALSSPLTVLGGRGKFVELAPAPWAPTIANKRQDASLLENGSNNNNNGMTSSSSSATCVAYSTLMPALAPQVHLSSLLQEKVDVLPLVQVARDALVVNSAASSPNAAKEVMANINDSQKLLDGEEQEEAVDGELHDVGMVSSSSPMSAHQSPSGSPSVAVDGGAVAVCAPHDNDEGSPTYAAVPMKDVLRRVRAAAHSVFEDLGGAPPSVRPRGGTTSGSVFSPVPSVEGPYIHKPLLLQAVKSTLQLVGEEAQLDMPLCLTCWREAVGELQKEADAKQSDVTVSSGYVSLTNECRSMCYRPSSTCLSQQHNASPTTATKMHWTELLSEEGIKTLEELRALEVVFQDLERESEQLQLLEAAMEAEEEMVCSHTNAMHLCQHYEVDHKQMLMTDRLQLEAELEFHSEQCVLREMYVIEIPSASNAAYATINGLRIGAKDADPIGATNMSSSASSPVVASSSSSPLMLTFPTHAPFPIRDIARLTDGDRYFPLGGGGRGGGIITPSEINGACGFLAAALKQLAQRNQLSLKSCIIYPVGYESTVDVPIPNRKPVQYNTYDFHIVERFFAWKTFGSACVAYTAALKELVEFLQQALNSRLDVASRHQEAVFAPYKIDADGMMIGGYSVKHGSVSDEHWGKAMRCVLCVLDWCLCAQTVLEKTQRASLRKSVMMHVSTPS